MIIIDFNLNFENYFGKDYRDENSVMVQALKFVVTDKAYEMGLIIDKFIFKSYDWLPCVGIDGRKGMEPNFTFSIFRKDQIGQTEDDFPIDKSLENLPRYDSAAGYDLFSWIKDTFVPLKMGDIYEIVFKKPKS